MSVLHRAAQPNIAFATHVSCEILPSDLIPKHLGVLDFQIQVHMQTSFTEYLTRVRYIEPSFKDYALLTYILISDAQPALQKLEMQLDSVIEKEMFVNGGQA